MEHVFPACLSHLVISVCFLLLTVSISAARFTLNPISVLYVPYEYEAGTEAGRFGIAKGASEQSSYDAKHHILYIAGDHFIHIVNVSEPSNPDIIHRLAIGSLANDIEVCGDYVGFVQNGLAHRNAPGTLQLYRLFNESSGEFTRLHEIPVGSIPDMLYFTKDCQTIVIVNEGERGPTADPDVLVDPEGTVSIIRLSQGGFTINDLNFTSFNVRAAEYESSGVRYPFKSSTFSQNLEPEYVTFNADDSKAYVSLQENNAIAVIDLQTETIDEIYSLGAKSWKNLRLDASNRDGGISFGSYDIYSFYQPDSIKFFEAGGEGYIVTANEGASIEYPGWQDEKRGKSLVDDGQVWGESPLMSDLNDTTKLGRLKFSQYDGLNASRANKIDTFYFFGGRSISIRRASDLELVYDTGDEVELRSSELLTNVFNADTKPIDRSPEMASDQRSDDHGPECESLAFGEIDGTRILFVGIERLSAILMYQFASGSPIPIFDSFYRAGGTNASYEQLLEDKNLGDLDPEDIKFLSAEKSPTGSPFLIVTNNIAGTIAFYDVIDNGDLVSTPTSAANKLCIDDVIVHFVLVIAAIFASRSVYLR